MAFVTINSQPSTNSVCGTLTNIDFKFTETTANTVNVIVQCYWYKFGAWQTIGGKIRVASNLYNSQQYDFNAAGVAALLDKAELSDLTGLGSGDGCSGGGFETLIFNTMVDKSDFPFKLEVQREYLNTTSNTIELDSDITTSNEFYVWEASPPISNQIYDYWAGSQSTNRYMLPYLMTDNNNQNSNWLWMTDCVLQRKKICVAGMQPQTMDCEWEWVYDVKIKPIEQHYIFCGNGNLRSGITNYNNLIIRTYDVQGELLNVHTYNWGTIMFGGYSNAGRCFFDAGWRTLSKGLTMDVGSEGVDGINVHHYVIWNEVADASNVVQTPSVKWLFTIDRNCTKKARPMAAYQRFAWKNALGGFDFFTSDGMLKTERKYKPSRYAKRVTALGSSAKGKQNYQTEVEYRHKVTTQEMSNLEAEWLSKMLASPQTYIRVEVDRGIHAGQWPTQTNLIGMNAPAYQDFDIIDGMRDSAVCNEYIPIVINTKSIQISTTKDNTVKLKFTYSYASDNQYLRD